MHHRTQLGHAAASTASVSVIESAEAAAAVVAAGGIGEWGVELGGVAVSACLASLVCFSFGLFLSFIGGSIPCLLDVRFFSRSLSSELRYLLSLLRC